MAPPGGADVSPGGARALPATVTEDLDRILSDARPALDRLAGATVLVTGGLGFLPGYLVDALARANQLGLTPPCRILCLDNLFTGSRHRLEHLVGREDVVLLEQDLVGGCRIDERVDYVVHGASIASPTWYRRYPLQTIDVNVTGTRHVLELARTGEVRGLLYLSSSEVYGDPPAEQIPTPEEYWGHVSCTGPRAPYDESKRLAETLVSTYHRHFGLPTVVARPFNVYGPGLRLDDGRVIPDFFRDVLEGGPVTLHSDGRATRSFCYVTDATTALLLLLCLGERGQAYNVGNDEEVSIRRVAELAAALPGGSGRIRTLPSPDPDYLTDNPQRRMPDLTKLRKAVPWEPRMPLREGLTRTHDAYRQWRV